MSNQFNILFASDRSYSAHLATALFSLLEHNPKWQFYIHVATTDLTDQDVDILNDITSSFGVKLKVHYLSNTMFYGLVLNHHFTNANYYRIFADELIPADSVLYLDADLIVVDSLDDLFGTNLGDSYLAAVENPGFNRHDELGMDRESKYFNSGVMLINLKKWREDGIKDAVINLVRERPEAIHFVDQCGLNGVINGKWVELPFEFNIQTSFLTDDITNGDENICIGVQSALKTPKIIHFTGSSKPWHLNNKHIFKKKYWSYRNKTAYRSFFSDDFGLKTLIRFLIPTQVKKFVKRLFSFDH